MSIWEKVSSIVAIVGVIISIIATYVAIQGTGQSVKISSEALETARQANAIALGLIREPAVVEFSEAGSSSTIFDFTEPQSLSENLKHYVLLKNVGKKSVDALEIEVIGIGGLTYRLSPPFLEIRSLPSVSTRVDLRAAFTPDGALHLDVRRLLLLYLAEVLVLLPQGEADYLTVVNIVLYPKATDEHIPASAGLDRTTNDRYLIKVKFRPSVIESAEAKRIIQTNTTPHRVFGR